MSKATSDYEQGRKEVVTEVFKALILVNAGACLALVTFLKDAKGNHLLPGSAGVVLGMFASGLVLAFVSAWIRFDHSIEAEIQARNPGQVPWFFKNRLHLWLQAGSAFAFLLGCAVAAIQLQEGELRCEKPPPCECHCR